VDIAFTVRLPVDSSSVPFVRGLCRQALEHLRVQRPVVDEITLALTEACADVLRHAGEHADYEVQVAIDDALCRIAVFDDGDGFEPGALPEDRGDAPRDGGRGLLLMQALVDRLDFRHDPDGRRRVTLEKRLAAPPPLRLVDPV
jgi:serine/threonine-protein kinase RsbW